MVGDDSNSDCGIGAPYPCGVATVNSAHTRANVTFYTFPGVPVTFTDLVTINNTGLTARSITAITVSAITNSAYLGSIDVYYCPPTSPTNPPTSATCNHYLITSTAGGSLTGALSYPISLPAGEAGYFEFVATASGSATNSSYATFQINVTWT